MSTSQQRRFSLPLAILGAAVLVGEAAAASVSIRIDPSQRFQQMEGFGASLTESSASLMSTAMSASQRTALMQSLFNPNTGAGLSFLRQPMGSSDFALSNYTYDDMPPGQTDYSLAHFSIARDRAQIIPLLQAAKSINPSLRLMGTPWSPPAWMKRASAVQTTPEQMYGGHLKDSAAVYDAYANYFVKYVQSYAAAGLNINYVSLQNEPWYETLTYPSMGMDPAELARLLKVVGPKFAASGLSTRILAWDHNWDSALTYANQLMTDPQAAAWIDGFAFHGYGGAPSAQSVVHDAYPAKGVFFTELSSTLGNTNFAGDLMWDMQNLIVGGARNWSKSVVRWNLALDQNGNPRLPGGAAGMRGLVTVNSNTGAVTLNEEFYSLAHLSKFVDPGAFRIASDDAKSVAFANPDGTIALVAYNDSASPRDVLVHWKGRMLSYQLPRQSVATLSWDGATGNASQVWLTTGDRSKLLARQADVPFNTTTWTADRIGDWHAGANWSVGVPDAVDDVASLGPVNSAPRTVYLDQPLTLGTLRFDSPQTYVVAGTASLTMQVSEGIARIEATAGEHKLNVPLLLRSDTSFSALSGATLRVSDPVTVDHNASMTISGAGSVMFESHINLASGSSLWIRGNAHLGTVVLASGARGRVAIDGRGSVDAQTLTLGDDSTFDIGSSLFWLADCDRASAAAMLRGGRIVSRSVDSAGGRADLLLFDAAALEPTRAQSGMVFVAALLGDVDLNGVVTPADRYVVVAHLGESVSMQSGWLAGDVDRDGWVTYEDLRLTEAHLGLSLLPEPTAFLSVLSIAMVVPGRCRKTERKCREARCRFDESLSIMRQVE